MNSRCFGFSISGSFVLMFFLVLKVFGQGVPRIVWTTAGYNGENIPNKISVSADGVFVASLQVEGINSQLNAGLILWSLPTGEFRRKISVSGNAVAISRDSKSIAIATSESLVGIYGADGGNLIKNLSLVGGKVVSVDYSGDGSSLVAGASNVVSIWDANTWAPKTSWNAPSNVNSIVFLKDNRSVLGAFQDGCLWKVDAITGAANAVITNQTKGVRDLTLSQDGTLVAAVSTLGVRIYRTSDYSEVQRISGGYRCNAISGDGAFVALGGDASIEVRKVLDGSLAKSIATAQVNAIRFSVDGTQLFAAIGSGLFVWDTDAWLSRELTGNSDSVESVSFSRDGRSVAFGCNDGSVRIRNVSDKSLNQSISGSSARLGAVRFSPTADLLAVGGGDSIVRLYESSTGGLIRKLTGHNGFVTSLSFATNGLLLASGSWDGTIRIWDTNGGIRNPIVAATNWVNDVSISQDGSIIAECSMEGLVRVFTVDGYRIFSWTNEVNTGPCKSVAVSPHKMKLAACDFRDVLRIWNLQTGNLEKTITGAGGTVTYSATGEYLVTVGNGKANVFNASNGDIIQAYDEMVDLCTSVAIPPKADVFAYGTADGFGILAAMPTLPAPSLQVNSGPCPVISWSDEAVILEQTPSLDQPWVVMPEATVPPISACGGDAQHFFRARWATP